MGNLVADQASRALIIINPRARSGEGTSQQTTDYHQHIEKCLRQVANVDRVEWVETRYPRHAVELARTAAQQGVGCVLAGGGDGTVSEVVNGLMSADAASSPRPIFGVLPLGTLNDFHVALKAAEQQKPMPNDFTQPLDIGRVTFANPGDLVRYMCLSISIGLSSWANFQYQKASHRFGRGLAHVPAVINTLLTYRVPGDVRVSFDGKPAQTRRLLVGAINNVAGVAGGVRLTPAARIDDGQFDICLIKPTTWWKLAQVLFNAYGGGGYCVREADRDHLQTTVSLPPRWRTCAGTQIAHTKSSCRSAARRAQNDLAVGVGITNFPISIYP